MSEITPSDGGYYYNSKDLSDLEDDVRAEAKRNQVKSQEAEDAREKKQLDAAHKKERDLSEAADRIRRKSEEAYVRDRDQNREELGKIKAQNYDRFGRSGGESADELKQQVETLKRSSEQDRRENAANSARLEKYSDQRVEEQAKQSKETQALAVREARDSAQATLQEHVQNEKRAFRDNTNDAHETYTARDRERTDEAADFRRHMQADFKKQADGFEYSTERLQRASEAKIQAAEERSGDRSAKEAKTLQESHQAETADLRDQVAKLRSTERTNIKAEAQARADSIREREDEFRTYGRLLNERTDAETGDLKRKMGEVEHNLNRRNNEMATSKDAFYSDVISRTNQDNRVDRKDLEDAFQNDHNQMESQLHKDRAQADQRLESTLESASQGHADALKAQAGAANESILRQKQYDEANTRLLQAELDRKTNAKTAADISPQAEEHARQTFLRENDKVNASDRTRIEGRVASQQQNFRERYGELLEAKQNTEARLHQQAAYDQTLERSAFVDGLQEVQLDKESSLRNADHRHETESQNQARTTANTMEHQRRDYEQMIQDLRDTASTRQSAIRQDADFNLRMTTRAFSTKQNELIREYEKKLADQKGEYDSQFDDLKTASQQTVHEKDKQTKLALEDQARNYEQRLAQLEVQHKERERLITENYSDELEKVKRSNALLIQKKG